MYSHAVVLLFLYITVLTVVFFLDKLKFMLLLFPSRLLLTVYISCCVFARRTDCFTAGPQTTPVCVHVIKLQKTSHIGPNCNYYIRNLLSLYFHFPFL